MRDVQTALAGSTMPVLSETSTSVSVLLILQFQFFAHLYRLSDTRPEQRFERKTAPSDAERMSEKGFNCSVWKIDAGVVFARLWREVSLRPGGVS